MEARLPWIVGIVLDRVASGLYPRASSLVRGPPEAFQDRLQLGWRHKSCDSVRFWLVNRAAAVRSPNCAPEYRVGINRRLDRGSRAIAGNAAETELK